MKTLYDRIHELDWEKISHELHNNGYTILKELVPGEECDGLKEDYVDVRLYRKTVVMERYRFGIGEYRYFNYPLPSIIELLRTEIYPKLAVVANQWTDVLNVGTKFPGTHRELIAQCVDAGQNQATPLILKYGEGGFNTLHQDLYGEVYFPMQMVLFLDQAGVDYSGGEFVLTEQNPRAQSKAIVLQPGKGDILVFPTNFRPVKGKKGNHRVHLKHGVSPVHNGQRHTLGIIFHDAQS